MIKPVQPYEATYQQLFEISPPSSVTLGDSQADIISPGRGIGDSGFETFGSDELAVIDIRRAAMAACGRRSFCFTGI